MAKITFDRESPIYSEELSTIISILPWHTVVGKSIAITGATGLLGTRIIDVLMYLNDHKDANISVYALGRNEAKISARFDSYMSNSLFHFVKYEACRPFPEISVDFVIHCAGNSHPKCFADDPIGTLLNNIKGAENVLNFANQCGAEVLILSSGEVYGQNTIPDKGMTEDYTGSLTLDSFRSCYTEGKRAVEALCQSYIYQKGTKVKIARPCRIFGPTMTDEDNKASAQFLKKAFNREDIILKSNGQQVFSYIYDADAVCALLYILLCGNIGQAYNVSSPMGHISLIDFAKQISAIADVQLKIDNVGEPGGSTVTNAVLDCSRLLSIGWRPIYGIPEAINRTLMIMKAHEN